MLNICTAGWDWTVWHLGHTLIMLVTPQGKKVLSLVGILRSHQTKIQTECKSQRRKWYLSCYLLLYAIAQWRLHSLSLEYKSLLCLKGLKDIHFSWCKYCNRESLLGGKKLAIPPFENLLLCKTQFKSLWAQERDHNSLAYWLGHTQSSRRGILREGSSLCCPLMDFSGNSFYIHII